jgi:hypothetical protein
MAPKMDAQSVFVTTPRVCLTSEASGDAVDELTAAAAIENIQIDFERLPFVVDSPKSEDFVILKLIETIPGTVGRSFRR